jgi:hypothetical protein
VTSENRVLVIGADGVLGSIVAEACERAGWEVRRGSRGPRVGMARVDVTAPLTVSTALDGVDAVINAVPDPLLRAERVVLDHGGVLLNVTTLPAEWRARLGAVAGGTTGAVVLNGGLAPGMTNLVAADLVARHPEADTIALVLCVSDGSTRARRDALAFGERERGWLGSSADGRAVRVEVLPPGVVAEPVAHRVAVLAGGEELAARTVRSAGLYVRAGEAAAAMARALAQAPPAAGVHDVEDVLTLDALLDELPAVDVVDVRSDDRLAA